MVAFPSLVTRSRGAIKTDTPFQRRALDEDVVCARIALEERYLQLMTSADSRSVDELQGVRARLHRLAEIEAEPQAPSREAALRSWLRSR